ncbi:MAG: glycoside hydrolase family 99-like domain-containing protein [Treponema sp.]|nr:glycoside hydrolase family 99-like domain-containing protein [Treponema sp.]
MNSWNEWTETSYLEPDDLYGYGYLEAVRRVFRGPDK